MTGDKKTANTGDALKVIFNETKDLRSRLTIKFFVVDRERFSSCLIAKMSIATD